MARRTVPDELTRVNGSEAATFMPWELNSLCRPIPRVGQTSCRAGRAASVASYRRRRCPELRAARSCRGEAVDEIEVEGLRIAYRRAGQGPPLVLLHGFVGDSREWRRQIEGLSDEFTVVAWDAPGAGGSSDPPDAFRLADYADCLAAFIDTLGLSRPHVAGVSFGGALA